MNQNRRSTGSSGRLVTSVIATVASVGSSTTMTALCMSSAIATMGVAMNGKPNPSVPWMKPDSTHARKIQRMIPSGSDSRTLIAARALA